jgi:hypothetical protein
MAGGDMRETCVAAVRRSNDFFSETERERERERERIIDYRLSAINYQALENARAHYVTEFTISPIRDNFRILQ